MEVDSNCIFFFFYIEDVLLFNLLQKKFHLIGKNIIHKFLTFVTNEYQYISDKKKIHQMDLASIILKFILSLKTLNVMFVQYMFRKTSNVIPSS